MESFHLSTEHFPTSTRELLPLDVILRHGVLPLGYKASLTFFLRPTKRLNLGLLDTRRDSVRKTRSLIRQRLGKHEFGRIRFYRITPKEFVQVLQTIYGLQRSEIHAMSDTELDGMLRRYLDGGL